MPWLSGDRRMQHILELLREFEVDSKEDRTLLPLPTLLYAASVVHKSPGTILPSRITTDTDQRMPAAAVAAAAATVHLL